MRERLLLGSSSVLLALAAGGACGGGQPSSGFGDNPGGSNDGGGRGDGATPGDDNGEGGCGLLCGDGGDAPTCNPDPGNYDIPGNGCDDDGDGKVDNTPVCDQALAATGTADDFAKAIGLCQKADATHWGVVSAAFTQGYQGGGGIVDGQHGILPRFGSTIKPREGSSLGVLSSGYGREYDDLTNTNCAGMGAPCFKGGVDLQNNGFQGIASGAPPGYPKPAAGCMVSNVVHDAIAVKLVVKVPKNAQGFSFDFDFWSGEWPEFVCTTFNDGFAAWLTSQAWKGAGGDFNVSFDSQKNPVSVNNAFFQTCTNGAQTGCAGGPQKTASCPLGTGELNGTGFLNMGTYCTGNSSGGGATGWLQTKAPVQPGESMTIQFIVWDTGDGIYDSSVLVDDFVWSPTPDQGTVRPQPK